MRHLIFSLLFFALITNASAAPREVLPWQKQKQQMAPVLPTGKASSEPLGGVINRVERYLNQLTTMQASFVQVAPDGSISEGKFYLSRPGKLRWEYFPPVRVTIVANSGLVTYYDAELDQISHTSVSSTPLVFLTENNINLTKGDITVKNAIYNQSAILVTLTQHSKEEDGFIELMFTDNPLELRKMTLVDAVGNRTTVSFNDAIYTQNIDKKLFIFENPRLFKKRKK